MSAWDITGAIIWSILLVAWTWELHRHPASDPYWESKNSRAMGQLMTTVVLALDIFCIARLFGAHA